MAVLIKTAVFWDVMPHNNLVQTHHHFEESTNSNFREEKMCIFLQNIGKFLPD